MRILEAGALRTIPTFRAKFQLANGDRLIERVAKPPQCRRRRTRFASGAQLCARRARAKLYRLDGGQIGDFRQRLKQPEIKQTQSIRPARAPVSSPKIIRFGAGEAEEKKRKQEGRRAAETHRDGDDDGASRKPTTTAAMALQQQRWRLRRRRRQRRRQIGIVKRDARRRSPCSRYATRDTTL